jgi:S-adenosylmethionine hydrolase
LAGGAALAEIGEPRENVKLLDTTRPDRARDDLVYGEIIYINRFGNLVTNIHVSDLADCHVKEIRAGDFTLGGLKQSYADVPPKMPLALIGSAGYLEVAYNNDRADVRLDLSLGIRVTVVVEPNAN